MLGCALNGIFHVVTTFLFREYSPGVVTGTLLFFPATGYFLFQTVRGELLMPSQLAAAVVIGIVTQIAMLASLWLHMDIDWRLRRPSRLDQSEA